MKSGIFCEEPPTNHRMVGTFFHGKRLETGNVVLYTLAGHAIAHTLDPVIEVLKLHPWGRFDWGYGGLAPSQLSFALIANVLGPHLANLCYRDFLQQVVSAIFIDEWWMQQSFIEDEVKKILRRSNVRNEGGADR